MEARGPFTHDFDPPYTTFNVGLIEGGGPGESVAIALEAPSLEDVTDPVGRTFRAFADQTRSDRRALAACLRGSRRLMTSEEAAGIGVPVLIAVGTRDEIAGSAAALGKIIPGAEVLDIPNRDHMRAVGDKVYKVGVTDFLDVVMHSGDLELWLEECKVWPNADIHGKTVAEAGVRSRTGANVLAVRRFDGGSVLTNPPMDMRFEPGDVLIALGTRDQLQALEKLTNVEP